MLAHHWIETIQKNPQNKQTKPPPPTTKHTKNTPQNTTGIVVDLVSFSDSLLIQLLDMELVVIYLSFVCFGREANFYPYHLRSGEDSLQSGAMTHSLTRATVCS